MIVQVIRAKSKQTEAPNIIAYKTFDTYSEFFYYITTNGKQLRLCYIMNVNNIVEITILSCT